jgi:predicted porin
VVNAGCSADGLDGNLVAAGVAYYLDPSFYVFGLYARLTNGSSARFNNNGSSTKQTPVPGEQVTQASVGIAYIF